MTNTHTYDVTLSHSQGRMICKCPECGRHVVFDTEPYQKTVIVVGDDIAIHRGGTGGVVIDSANITDEEGDYWEEQIKKLGLDKPLSEL